MLAERTAKDTNAVAFMIGVALCAWIICESIALGQFRAEWAVEWAVEWAEEWVEAGAAGADGTVQAARIRSPSPQVPIPKSIHRHRTSLSLLTAANTLLPMRIITKLSTCRCRRAFIFMTKI